MIKKLYFLYFLILPTISQAQGPSLWKGLVTNIDEVPIPHATVYLLNTNYSTTTNTDGHFNMATISAGFYKVKITAIGYAALIENLTIKNSVVESVFKLPSSDKQLDEITVSAQKTEDEAQKLPLTISTFSAQDVEEYRLWNSKDITAIVPNLYSSNSGDNRNVTSIRGITTTSYNPAVATYIDGVNQFTLDTYIGQLEDIERIEVLRGPQGTLYGRDAMGGVINITTKQPANTPDVFVETDFGNYNQQRYNLGLRVPLIKNKLFLGASALFTKQNGFYINEFNNSNFDNQHSFLGNYYLKYLISSKLAITLNVKHVENRNDGTFPLAADPVTALSQPFKVDQNAVTTLVDNTLNTSLSVRYIGKAFNFTSQSAYQSNYRYYQKPIDGDFSPIDGITIVNNYGSAYNKVKVGTQEFRFTSPSSQQLIKWVGGIYGFYESNPVKQGTHFGADAKEVGAPFPDFTDIAINKENVYGLALYGQGVYNITQALNLTFGLRYDYEHDKLGIKGLFQMDGQPATVTRSDTSSAASFKAFSPKAAINYIIGTNSSLYAIYSKGFRAGGISQLSSDPSQPPLYTYNPESSNNYELGSKNTFWGNRIRLNADVFYTTVNNAQVPTLILPDAITITRNAGKLNSKGAELELMIKLLKGLDANYNWGYTHARYTSLLLANNGASENLKGNQQIFTPDVTSALALQYSHALDNTNIYRLVIRGEWRYIGKQYFDLANTIKQNPYNLFNSRIGVSTKNYGLFLWGANIFNKHYIDYAYDFGATHLGDPRIYGVTIRANLFN